MGNAESSLQSVICCIFEIISSPRLYDRCETKGEKVSFEMKPDAAVDVEKIPVVLEEYKRELSFQVGKNPTFVLDLSKTKKVKQLEKIEHCVNSLNSLIIR